MLTYWEEGWFFFLFLFFFQTAYACVTAGDSKRPSVLKQTQGGVREVSLFLVAVWTVFLWETVCGRRKQVLFVITACIPCHKQYYTYALCRHQSRATLSWLWSRRQLLYVRVFMCALCTTFPPPVASVQWRSLCRVDYDTARGLIMMFMCLD